MSIVRQFVAERLAQLDEHDPARSFDLDQIGPEFFPLGMPDGLTCAAGSIWLYREVLSRLNARDRALDALGGRACDGCSLNVPEREILAILKEEHDIAQRDVALAKGEAFVEVEELTEEQVERIRGGERDPVKLGLFEGRSATFVGAGTVIAKDGSPRHTSDEIQPGDRLVVDDEIPFGDDEGGAS